MNFGASSLPTWLGLALCTVAFGAGSVLLVDYSNRPGSSGLPLRQWPSDVPGNDADQLGQARLLLFLHPHCPCSKATVRELARLSGRFAGPTPITAYVYCPSAEDSDWIESSNIAAAREIPMLHVIVDPDAQFCRQFGVRTSGHMLLYDGHDQLMFSGGITSRRGHEGLSTSATDLLRRVNGLATSLKEWPVFGCPIITPESD